MNFQESVKTCFSKYAEFSGRADRSEYWWFFLFLIVASAACTVISPKLAALFSVGTFIPWLAVAVRRLRDAGLSVWWILAGLVPFIGWLVVLVLLLQPSRN
jgi:uncharacterized membrane protein YhaH (DUF805 family)